MSDIPLEAQELINNFNLAEEAKRRVVRKEAASYKAEVPFPKGKLPSMNCGQVERLARQEGLEVRGGGGKHGKSIYSPDNIHRMVLPDHGSRDLAKGTLINILGFIERYGIKS